jgi:hypothetical protein
MDASGPPLPASPDEAKELGEEAQLAALVQLVRMLDEALFEDALPVLRALAAFPASRAVSALAFYLQCLAHRRAHVLLSERTRGWEAELAWLADEANHYLLESYEAQLALA